MAARGLVPRTSTATANTNNQSSNVHRVHTGTVGRSRTVRQRQGVIETESQWYDLSCDLS
jgi:hypothetical protein